MMLKSFTPISLATLAVGAFLHEAARAGDKVDFAREIRPILESACVQCHGSEKQKGKLRLDSRDAWMKGGDGGPVFTAGDPEKSDFFQRVNLPEDHDDVMPPKGKADHLTPAQIDRVRQWIVEGAEWPEGVVAIASSMTKPVGLDAVGPAPSADESKALAELEKRGVKVRRIASGVNWRRADLRGRRDERVAEILPVLARIPSIQELDLGGAHLRDEDLASIGGLTNLKVLHLESSGVTDAALQHLGGLQKLSYLNLFGTGVTDVGLKRLAGIKRLQSIYLAGTKVTANGVSELKQQLPQAEIEAGAEFTEIAKKDPEPPKKPAPMTPAPKATPTPIPKTDLIKP